MRAPSYEDSLHVLLLQAADEGRDKTLVGTDITRAAREAGPFMVGEKFPSVYLECPLTGEPFLDITVLYGDVKPGVRVNHTAAEGANGMLDWFAGVCDDRSNICCGFELDLKEPELPAAAVHFQPRAETNLVLPFCESVGEPERAKLYLDQGKRMPEGWPLSFFGMFRGRPGSPLRVCGYMHQEEQKACADDAKHLVRAFDKIGFTEYDDAMLSEVGEFMAAAPGGIDFQFDVFPDGSIGDTFAIDAQFKIEQPEAVQESFSGGRAERIMRLFEEKGAADDRWKLVPNAAFARALPAERPDGSCGRFSFALMPQWAKARWRKRELQPGKMYFLASAGFLDDERDGA